MKIGIITLCQRKAKLMDYIRPKILLLEGEVAMPYLTVLLPPVKKERYLQKLILRGRQRLEAMGAERILLSQELLPYAPEEVSAAGGIPPEAVYDLLQMFLPALCRYKVFQRIYLLDRAGSHLHISLFKLLRQYGRYLCVHTEDMRKGKYLERKLMEEWGLLLDVDAPSGAPPRGSNTLLIDFDRGFIRVGRDLKITGIEPDIPLPEKGVVEKERLIPCFLPEYRTYGVKNLCLEGRWMPLNSFLRMLEEEGRKQKKSVDKRDRIAYNC